MRPQIMSTQSYPAGVGKLTDEQVARRSTWGKVPDNEMTAAAMHVIRIVPVGGSTITEVNPLDPASSEHGEEPGWYERPAAAGTLFRHRPGAVWA